MCILVSSDIDECLGDPCTHGVCKDRVNTYQCNCDSGWTGYHCDTPVSPARTTDKIEEADRVWSLVENWPDELGRQDTNKLCLNGGNTGSYNLFIMKHYQFQYNINYNILFCFSLERKAGCFSNNET